VGELDDLIEVNWFDKHQEYFIEIETSRRRNFDLDTGKEYKDRYGKID